MNNYNMVNRRNFLKSTGSLGALALSHMLGANTGKKALHHTAKAKRVIFLTMSGGPSQMDLFDYKPVVKKWHGKEIPESVYPAERKTTMTSEQASFPGAESPYKFKQHGDNGMWVSDLLPYTAKHTDELCFIRSMHTSHINHDPAITFLQTGHQLAGRPSMGAWVDFGLGSENQNLPAYVALTSRGTGRIGQPLYDRLWGNGFLPGKHQGVKFRNSGDAILDTSDPKGMSRDLKRKLITGIAALNKDRALFNGDPNIETRINQYELAFRMQTSVPELIDMSREPEHVYKLYGEDSKRKGTFAYNCLMARRLAERDVRFIQLFHTGWDQHSKLENELPKQCKNVDQASMALVQDLKQRGLLEDTLVIWGGEFGRTVYAQGIGKKAKKWGRDHHPGCFTMWMAGGGIKQGVIHGETDDFSVNVVKDGVDIHDLHATILYNLGINHKKLTYKFQGRYFRITDVHGHVVKSILT